MWKFTNEYVPNNTHGKINEFSRNSEEADFTKTDSLNIIEHFY